MVYFTSSSCFSDDQRNGYLKDGIDASSGTSNHRVLRRKLHFLKFETSNISECIKFISSKNLQHYGTLFYDDQHIKMCEICIEVFVLFHIYNRVPFSLLLHCIIVAMENVC